jgi:hypothetical protein
MPKLMSIVTVVFCLLSSSAFAELKCSNNDNKVEFYLYPFRAVLEIEGQGGIEMDQCIRSENAVFCSYWDHGNRGEILVDLFDEQNEEIVAPIPKSSDRGSIPPYMLNKLPAYKQAATMQNKVAYGVAKIFDSSEIRLQCNGRIVQMYN